MLKKQTTSKQFDATLDVQELEKFANLAENWWDKEGPLKTLHDINGARLEFILNNQDLLGAKVLDVGCGGGILTEAMAALGANVVGIDAENDVIKAAVTHMKTMQFNSGSIHYLCLPLQEYQAPLFDIITCMEMLEHVICPELVIKHCARLLKPGGYLFLSTLNRTLKSYFGAIVAAEYILGLLPRQTHDFKKFIKPSELASVVRETGLEVKCLSGMIYNPFTRHASLHAGVGINYLMACSKV